MTTVELPQQNSQALRRTLVRAIAGSVFFGALFTGFGAFGPFNGDWEVSSGNAAGWLIGVAAVVVAAAIVWMAGKSGTVPGNLNGAANRALIFGIVAVLSFPAFWLGIYAVFAAGAFTLGGASIRQASGAVRAKAIVGMVLAAVATFVCAGANLFG